MCRRRREIKGARPAAAAAPSRSALERRHAFSTHSSLMGQYALTDAQGKWTLRAPKTTLNDRNSRARELRKVEVLSGALRSPLRYAANLSACGPEERAG